MTHGHGGRLAVVSGGANGIGRAIVLRLAREGARVVSLDVADSAELLDAAATDNLNVTAELVDISSPQAVATAAAAIRDRAGDATVLVHSAAYQHMAPFSELEFEVWQRTQRVNVDGAFLLVREFLPAMRATGWGRIVLITSSTLVTPPAGMSHYVASKGALVGFARGLATEIGPDGVTINAVSPGLTDTGRLGGVSTEHFDLVLSRQAIKRRGRPDDQAAVVSFLVSDDAGFITGQTLLADGGEGRI